MIRHRAGQIRTALHDFIFLVRIAVGRERLWRPLDAGDDIGCVDALRLLCILGAMEFEEHSIISVSVQSLDEVEDQNLLFGLVCVDLEHAAQ